MQTSLTLHLVCVESQLITSWPDRSHHDPGQWTTITFCLRQPTVHTAIIILTPLHQSTQVSQHNNAMLNGEFEPSLLLVVLHALFSLEARLP